jgi:site-specific DNA recombinase
LDHLEVNMKTIGYVRVSSQEQANSGISLECQADKITAYCALKEWTLTEIVSDPGESAKSLKRLGIQRLMQLIKSHEVNTIIVYKLDRLTRSVLDLGTLLQLCEKHDVALVSIQESFDATTATGRLMMNLLMSVSQWEREVMGERTRDALQTLKAQGKPYSREMITDEDLLAEVKMLHETGWTYRGIANEFTARGIPTARGGRWQANTIRRLVMR